MSLAKALIKRGIHVDLAAIGPRLPDLGRSTMASIPGMEIFEYPCRLEWMAQPWGDLDRAGQWLLEIESRRAPDVLHVAGVNLGNLDTSAPRLFAIQFCLLTWWKSHRSQTIPASFEIYHRHMRQALQGATAVAVPTYAMGATLLRRYALARDIEVISHGVAVHAWTTRPKENFALAAGQYWDPAKNFATIETIAQACSMPIYVASSTKSPDSAPLKARHCKLLGHLPQNDLAQWMARARFFIHPARYEPVGLAVIEAAASGCILILADEPHLRELWQDAAVYVPADHPQGFAQACREILTNSQVQQKLAHKARMRARMFTIDAAADAYIEIYQRIAQRTQAQALG